ncbi:MAG: hypothetical protein COU83_02660 [Candidatus Portnoybacteria bacterium CG10_big_fil_rev_8_21_14_0_10_40_22]|uniref:Methyltransferase type 11 domain-containing protein n=1 Tax=Candidatus Portnoybacteria bacterium CG10_big_fil_rev_8_21_14_0_10_40_22 TaxID=1974814 RepID=A0A2M8KFH2_9BACT|nr:MAG: hypothetical protein COU83_02660 [Candidatus Portnoybacteria bacterium CG10_big_fil_rev_8_21_14_0_10_40_22]
MKTRKQKEIEHYDQAASTFNQPLANADIEGWQHLRFASYRFCQAYLKNRCHGKKLLDYGCGNGLHSIFPTQQDANVIGIDLSENSLKLARLRAQKLSLSDRIKFIKMDCEALEFPDHSFDIIWDGGTFSSLDIKKALPELAKTLKPDGFILGIETLGHNPLFNFKRKINQWRGRRTHWAVSHIFKMPDLKLAQKYFSNVQAKFFHLTFIDWLDNLLLKIPWLKKHAFKIVFVFSRPKKLS